MSKQIKIMALCGLAIKERYHRGDAESAEVFSFFKTNREMAIGFSNMLHKLLAFSRISEVLVGNAEKTATVELCSLWFHPSMSGYFTAGAY